MSQHHVPFVTEGSTSIAEVKRERELAYAALYVKRRLHLSEHELKQQLIELDHRLKLMKQRELGARNINSKNEDEEEGEHARHRFQRRPTRQCCLWWLCVYVPLYFVLAFVTFALMTFLFRLFGLSGSSGIHSTDFLQLPQ